MQFSTILALATGLLSVSAEQHSNLHRRAHARDLSKRAVMQLNNLIAVPTPANNQDVQEGFVKTLAYQTQVINNSTSNAAYTCWEKANFAVPVTAYNTNPAAPLIVVNIPAGEERWVSFSDNFSGACAAVYADTVIGAGGNIKEAWIELTTTVDEYSSATVDVSFQPNTEGRWTSVEVDGCISDKSLCSFGCVAGMTSCVNVEDVTFDNCSNDVNHPLYQPKANFGTFGGGLQGGCFIAGTKKFVVTLNSKQ